MSAPYNYQTDPSNYPGTPAGQQQLQRTQNQTPYEYAQTLPQWSQIAMFLRLYNNIQDDKARGFDTTQAEAEWRQRVNASGLNAIITDIIDPWGPQGEKFLRANGYDPNSLTPSYNNITYVREAVQQGLGKLTNSLEDANGNPLPAPSQPAANTTSNAAAATSVPEDKIIGTSAWRKTHPLGIPSQGDVTPAQAGVSLTQQADGSVTLAAPPAAKSSGTPTPSTAPTLAETPGSRAAAAAGMTYGAFMQQQIAHAAGVAALGGGYDPSFWTPAQIVAENQSRRRAFQDYLHAKYQQQQDLQNQGVSMTVNGKPANPHPGPNVDPLTGLPNSVAQSAHDNAVANAQKKKTPVYSDVTSPGAFTIKV